MSKVKTHPASFALSESDFKSLMRELEKAEFGQTARTRRKHARYPHSRRDVVVNVIQPGGGATTRMVAMCDLSASGAGLLYPGYLHSGSVVLLTLRRRLGGDETVRGIVVNCRHIHSSWHSVGIKFQELIYPKLFLDPGARTDFEEEAKVDVASMKGSVLVVDDQAMDRLLFAHMLGRSGIRITEATSCEEAMTLVKHSLAAEQTHSVQASGPFDAIVCDLNLGTVPGEQAIALFRQAGYRGPILVMTAETTQARIAAAWTAGASGVLEKPCTPEKVQAALAPWMSESAQNIEDPLYSPMAADPASRPLVEKYVAQVRTMITDLRRGIKEDDFTKVRLLCQTLKGTGSGYGFTPLTEGATSAITSLDSSCSVNESITELHRLEHLCARVTAVEPPRRAAGRVA